MPRDGADLAVHLREWLKAHNISYSAMARRLAETLANPRIRHETVRRHCLPEDHRDYRAPEKPARVAYYALTGGAVTSNDWDGLPSNGAAGAGAGGVNGASLPAAPGGSLRSALGGAPPEGEGAAPPPAAAPGLSDLVRRRAARSRAGRKAAQARWARFYARRARAQEPAVP